MPPHNPQKDKNIKNNWGREKISLQLGGKNPLITPKSKRLKLKNKYKQKTTEGENIPQGENPFIIPQKTKNKETKNKSKKLLDKL